MFPVYCSDQYHVPLPSHHPFPIEKYGRVRCQLVQEGTLQFEQLFSPELATPDELSQAHTESYVTRVLMGRLSRSEILRLGFPWSEELVLRSRASVGGTLAAARGALKHQIAGNLAGGTHHGHADFGSGFCVFNDVAVAIRVLQNERLITRALVVDLDVHQGDGTARIFQNDPRVYTFSMHGKNNFPAEKAQSSLDIELADQTIDEVYLSILERVLPDVIEHAQPEIVFFVAGVDPLASDRLGRLALTASGLRERDHRVLKECKRKRAPVALVMGGGYARPLEDAIEAHCNTYRVAVELHAKKKR